MKIKDKPVPPRLLYAVFGPWPIVQAYLKELEKRYGPNVTAEQLKALLERDLGQEVVH